LFSLEEDGSSWLSKINYWLNQLLIAFAFTSYLCICHSFNLILLFKQNLLKYFVFPIVFILNKEEGYCLSSFLIIIIIIMANIPRYLKF